MNAVTLYGVVAVTFMMLMYALEKRGPGFIAAIIVAIITAGFYAMRDELLLHGLVMRALVTVDVPILKVLAKHPKEILLAAEALQGRGGDHLCLDLVDQ